MPPRSIVAAPAVATDLARASEQAAIDAFANLRGYLSKRRWLGTRNMFRRDTTSVIDRCTQNGTLNQKHLAEYIAASAPLHASDGWGFLGRAMHAHLLGDRYAARHLAYYAELRAAMAILATQGIGIFDKNHYVVSTATTVRKITTRSRTHSFTWTALNWWADNNAWNLVGSAIRPNGITLNQWLLSAQAFASVAPVASTWIKSLGLDIQHMATDQYSRNDASYRPTRIVEPSTLDVPSSADFAVKLWRALEPGAHGFPNIDLHILRMTLDMAFKAVQGVSPRKKPAVFSAAVSKMMSDNAGAQQGGFIEKFLTRRLEPDDLTILQHAAVNSPNANPKHHMQVMSRAAALLVLATAAVHRLIKESGLALPDTAFWWQSLGAERGIWHTAPPTGDLRDLWEDIQIQLDELQDWAGGLHGHSTRADLLTDRPNAFSRLSQFELAGLWGLSA